MTELVRTLTDLAQSSDPKLVALAERIRTAQEAGLVSDNVAVFPGFSDVHVHFREPGQTYKETIATGTRAAARGGFTTVCTMPNLDPVPDTLETLALEEASIARDALIETLPYASTTMGQQGKEPTDIATLAKRAVAFSDDGHGVNDPDIMRHTLREIAKANSIIAIHSEDSALAPAGYCINDGPYAAKHGYVGIPKAAEYEQIRRDIDLLRELAQDDIYPAYHVCHISCGESADLIRQARAEGLNVTCETAAHYLFLDESMLEEDGRFKMNPPLREPADREALVEALRDGTIDVLATDHAPHSAEEKGRGLQGSAFGVVGIEFSFPLVYTYAVKTGIISLERAVELFTSAGRDRFNIPTRDTDLTVWDLGAELTIDPDDFASLGRATPFAGWKINGRCLATIYDGVEVYSSVDGVDVFAK
ncbi:MAG: dihydroorotase [Actinomycetaceae bacterium]|nr:dihydroorotase [Actinomycetaceae bacterium]